MHVRRYVGMQVRRYSCKVPVVLVRFERNLYFLNRVLKNIQISKFLKIPQVGTELFHSDGRMDVNKHIIAFRIFVNAPTITCRYARRVSVVVIQGAAEIVTRFKNLVTCFSARISRSASI